MVDYIIYIQWNFMFHCNGYTKFRGKWVTIL